MSRARLIEVDLRGVSTVDELHQLLLKNLNFPDWYGCNWDAFWDAITGLVGMPETLHLVGWSGFEARFPCDARIMRKCLEDMSTQYPGLASRVVYA